MIITCPDCATRYDVDDERFSPNGRSVRCSSCGESWFVPAPELIDVAPLEEKAPVRRKAGGNNEDNDESDSARPRMKVGIADADEEGRPRREARDDRDDRRSSRRGDDDRSDSGREFGRARDRRDDRHEKGEPSRERDSRKADYADDGDDDDALFDSPSSRNDRQDRGRDRDNSRDRDSVSSPDKKQTAQADKGWRKGRQFIVEDDEANAPERRSFFARKEKPKDDVRNDREDLRFADDADDRGSARTDSRYDDEYDDRDDGGNDYDNAYVVDADWEDVDDGAAETGRGFGRKIRAERRRATALARMEDVRPLDPEALDEEFFAALRVTPRELERAIRKARRRAEAREKNRLTPFRVIGWAAWTAVVAGAAYGVFVYRDEIVKMAPKTADAYAVIGIEANPYGLSIENVRHRLAMSTGGAMIEITGNLRNKSDGSVTAPLLQAEALGPRGELLARWTFTASQPEVAQGEMADFMTRAPAPEGVAEVALSFAPEKSVLESLLPSGQ